MFTLNFQLQEYENPESSVRYAAIMSLVDLSKTVGMRSMISQLDKYTVMTSIPIQW